MSDSSPTIYDVAERAGVSTATVSRALNSLTSLRPETRDKVFAAMEELKFTPNVVARGLASGKHWILGLVFMRAVVDETGEADETGVLVVEAANLLYTDIVIRGAEVRAAEYGYSLLLSGADERHPSWLESLLALSRTVDGLILLDRVLRDEDVNYLAQRIPIVMLGGRGDLPSVVTVRVDNVQAMRSLAHHLIVIHGLTRLGFVRGVKDSPDSETRAAAFKAATIELGGTLDEVDELQGDWTSAGGEAAVKRRLSRPEPLPQAFACANDQTAVGAIYALSSIGLSVPEDVVVTGFDDISLTRYFNPSLTTIRQSGSMLGEVAVESLRSMLDGTTDIPHDIVLPTELVVRRSCGCPGERELPRMRL